MSAATGTDAPTPAAESPSFPELESRDKVLAPLHHAGARPVQRDRWERLVTSAVIPDSIDRVCSALTSPEHLESWLAVCRGCLDDIGRETMLDFEDGEFFLCRTMYAGEAREDPLVYELRYVWRWLGIGQPATVTWRVAPLGSRATEVTVTEEAFNPPADWQTWNGGGWPGILNQLAAYLRTGTSWRWPWRRMGPYVQYELPLGPFEAWNALLSPAGLQYWLQRRDGALAAGESLTLVMGDASGTIELRVKDVADPGQRFPSFLPSVVFALARERWGCEVPGYLWMEPAGLGRSLLQVFHSDWDRLPPELQLSERKLVTGFWTGAMIRAGQMVAPPPTGSPNGSANGAHSWS